MVFNLVKRVKALFDKRLITLIFLCYNDAAAAAAVNPQNKYLIYYGDSETHVVRSLYYIFIMPVRLARLNTAVSKV